MSGSVLFWVQYLLGIGHLQRSLRIAEALTRAGIDVTILSGGEPVTALAVARSIKLVQLPPVRARDARFELVDSSGQPIDERLRAKRRTALLAAFAAVRPDALVLEGFPFARRAFRFELDPLIAALRGTRPRPRLVCSVRDIPTVRDDPGRRREIVDRIRGDFDAVLVHGDPSFIPFEVGFPAAPQIPDRLFYTGYVAPPGVSEPVEAAPSGEVLVSAGGGAAGQLLLAAALGARRLGCLAERPWRILAGTNLPDDAFAALQRGAPDGVTIERFRQDFPVLLRDCHVSVSQAGYNTVLDILAARARAVVVPFAAERETEQLVRAEQLAARGAVELLRESALTPAGLSAAIARAAAGTPVKVAIDTNGAERSAKLIGEMILGDSAQPLAPGRSGV